MSVTTILDEPKTGDEADKTKSAEKRREDDIRARDPLVQQVPFHEAVAMAFA